MQPKKQKALRDNKKEGGRERREWMRANERGREDGAHERERERETDRERREGEKESEQEKKIPSVLRSHS